MNQIPSTQKRGPLPVVRKPRFNFWSALGTVLSVAILIASLFTIWTPATLFNSRLSESLSKAMANQVKSTEYMRPTITPRPLQHIAIVSGHWEDGKGFECQDGSTEADINLNIATMVQQRLVAEGFTVDLMKEQDSRLMQYTGLLVLSIHADSCAYIDDSATGFKVASSYYTPSDSTKANRLVSCMIDRYANDTGLSYVNGVTDDMTEYHTFDEVNTNTPTVIIETGYLNLDYDLLTKQPDTVAKGITNGILCYLKNQPLNATATPLATP